MVVNTACVRRQYLSRVLAQIPDARPPVDGARGRAEDHRLGPALPHTRILRHGQCQLELNAWFQHLASWTASAPGFLFPLCHGAAPSGRILTYGRLLGAGSYGIMRQLLNHDEDKGRKFKSYCPRFSQILPLRPRVNLTLQPQSWCFTMVINVTDLQWAL